jgi:hypothetical protein
VTGLIGWEARLGAAVEEFRGRPFQWGAADCILFAATCAEAITGRDPAAPYRGKYWDARSAMAVMQELGFSDVGEAVRAHFVEIPMAMAGRGDLAIIAEASAEDPLGALGVVLGPIVAGYGATGLHFVSLAEITRAFRVA